jgi:hydroxyacylglutathione hydrolase
MLTIHTLILGPLENNTIIVADETSGEAIVVDPSFELDPIFDLLEENEYRLRTILLTHAHFDHTVNTLPLSNRYNPTIPIGLHSADLFLWENGGGAELFGVNFKPSRNPDFHLYHGQKISLGHEEIEVRQTPGHTPGSVVFILQSNQTVITGDLIFFHGVGRTDLPGGDSRALIRSIQTQIFNLPGPYHLIPGHGPETTIAEEAENNPFL